MVEQAVPVLGAAQPAAGGAVTTRSAHPAVYGDFSEHFALTTTHGVIAVLNLHAQIDGLESDLGAVESRLRLAELITLRGIVLGQIADYERAETIAEQLVQQAPDDETALLARARARTVFHRFADALTDIARAERLGLDENRVNEERAAIFQALGRYDEALQLREAALDRRYDFATVASLVALCAECGDADRAEHLYLASLSLYRGVSPFPLAALDFQVGQMHMVAGRMDRARTSFGAAVRRLPGYAPAQGHLAEMEAELGDTDSAVARLYRLARSTDDPDYAAQLARILSSVGCDDGSRFWRTSAAARYDELMAAHPEAFADHAAEFWLAAGGDPDKALRLAKINLAVRKTPRAYALFSRALGACGLSCAGAAPSWPADQIGHETFILPERKTDGYASRGK